MDALAGREIGKQRDFAVKRRSVGKVWHEDGKRKEVLVYAPVFDNGGRDVFMWLYREGRQRGVSFKGIFCYGYGDDGYGLWGAV